MHTCANLCKCVPILVLQLNKFLFGAMHGEQALIVAGDNQKHIYKLGGNTNDIISAIKYADSISIDYVHELAAQLATDDIAQTCANIYKWVKETIPYKEDKTGIQAIQLPGQLYNNRFKHLDGTGNGGDCKSMSLLCSSILRSIGNYNFKYRFISESANDDYHHVYLIVEYTDTNGKPCYIPLDCTLSQFGVETSYIKKWDMNPTEPTSNAISGAINYTSVSDAEESYWQYETKDLQNNYLRLKMRLEGMVEQDLKNHFRGQPLKFDITFGKIKDNWHTIFGFGSTLLYYYWNRPEYLPYTACRAGTGTTGNIPFPDQYAEKKATSDDFVNGLKNIGFRQPTINLLCSLGTFEKYGIGFEYMLYRCYCMQLYGQPFRPHSGVPYWNNTTGTFINNGANLQDTIKIALCFPAKGGVGMPFGQPYWSVGGHVINNGLDIESTLGEATMQKWLKENPRPGTTVPGVLYGEPATIEPGTIANNFAGIAYEFQLECLQVYNAWAKGNMVILPQPRGFGGKPAIGVPGLTETIVSVVVAVVTAVATIIASLAAAGVFSKKGDGQNKLALPTTDFEWSYQTTDGCLIGSCINVNGCNGATTAKMCNGQIVELNPSRTDPNNQPPDPGNFFGNMSNNKKLLLAGGGLMLVGGAYSLSE